MLVSGILYSDLTCMHYEMITMVSLVTVCPQSYYNIFGHIPYAVCYITIAYLFYNWSFVPLNPLHLIFPTPDPLSLWQPPLCSVFL